MSAPFWEWFDDGPMDDDHDGGEEDDDDNVGHGGIKVCFSAAGEKVKSMEKREDKKDQLEIEAKLSQAYDINDGLMHI